MYGKREEGRGRLVREGDSRCNKKIKILNGGWGGGVRVRLGLGGSVGRHRNRVKKNSKIKNFNFTSF